MDNQETKQCNTCNENKTLDAFRNTRNKCKQCENSSRIQEKRDYYHNVYYGSNMYETQNFLKNEKGKERIICDICKKEMAKHSLSDHLKTKKHIANMVKTQ